MTNRDFRAWLARIDELTHAQSDEVLHKILDLAVEDPIEDERPGPEDTPGQGPDLRSGTRIEVRWNASYEAAKPRLVERLRAMVPHLHPSDREQAKGMIAAVESLPFVGDVGGSLTITRRAARQVGDSDFVYWLDIGEAGFELSTWERMKIARGQSENAYERKLVSCRPLGEGKTHIDEDEEALEFMREALAEVHGLRMNDEDWQMQLDAARGLDDDLVPNGILRWLEVIPIDPDGEVPAGVSVEWGE